MEGMDMDEFADQEAQAREFVADVLLWGSKVRSVPRAQVQLEGLCRDAIDALGTRLDQARSAAARAGHDAFQRHIVEVSDTPLLGEISLFKAIGMCRVETAHTAALAWLLDANKPHGFGNALFRAFVSAVRRGGSGGGDWEALNPTDRLTYSVEPEYYLDPSCRIDLHIKGHLPGGRPWVMLVEAKVDADERVGQLADYDQALNREWKGRPKPLVLRAFLSACGRQASTARGTDWASLSFEQLAGAFLGSYPQLRGCAGHPFLRMYLTGLFEDLCGLMCASDASAVMQRNDWLDLERLLEDADA
jgi:hypothetical protein